VRQIAMLLCLAGLLAGCGSTPAPTPDAVATQVAVMEAAAATLTAGAPRPTATATAVPTQVPPPTAAPTAAPSQVPAPTATRRPAPTALPSPPPVGPSVGRFVVVGVYSGDVLNVRAGPGVEQPIVGSLPYYGQNVEVFAGDQLVGESWWVPVRHGQVSGWVNRSYLASQVGNVADAVAARSAQAILAIRDHDMQALARLVHPVKGVTFSPYAYVHPLQGAPGEADMVFSPAQLTGLWTDPTVYHWGTYDGSGEPIDLTFREYYGEFVYDVDFAQPQVVGLGETVGQGNSINNIPTVYPNGVTVEYHFEGFDPQYAGMDWRSLRLVLEELDGTWYVVGIVHDKWTI
jgi:Bacterial SH3 domain